MSVSLGFKLDSTLSGLAIVELTQGRPRRGGTNPGLYDSNPVGVGKKIPPLGIQLLSCISRWVIWSRKDAACS
jgi:hypothetical protein